MNCEKRRFEEKIVKPSRNKNFLIYYLGLVELLSCFVGESDLGVSFVLGESERGVSVFSGNLSLTGSSAFFGVSEGLEVDLVEDSPPRCELRDSFVGIAWSSNL